MYFKCLKIINSYNIYYVQSNHKHSLSVIVQIKTFIRDFVIALYERVPLVRHKMKANVDIIDMMLREMQ